MINFIKRHGGRAPPGARSQARSTTSGWNESRDGGEKGPLPEDVASRLDEIAAMLPHRPYEEPMILPFGKSYHGPGIANMGAAVQVGKLEL